MSDRLPPLTALRAFEAAARHLSFAKAADELHVTPAALSFQIKNLEEHLGAPVFRRLNRAVELTEAGRALTGGATEGFERLARAWTAARRVADRRTLTVTAGPAFTTLWLAPRLFGFASQHPQIELRFSASLKLMDFDRDEIDVAVRFGPGTDEGLYSQVLIREWITPMVAPDLAATIRTPQDLAHVPLLHQDDTSYMRPGFAWADWFRAAGATPPEGRGTRFSQADSAVSAALAGAGAILGRISVTESAVREGRLVMPFALSLWAPANYRIVCPEGAQTRPQVAAFIDWITAETRSLEALEQGRQFVAPPDDGSEQRDG